MAGTPAAVMAAPPCAQRGQVRRPTAGLPGRPRARASQTVRRMPTAYSEDSLREGVVDFVSLLLDEACDDFAEEALLEDAFDAVGDDLCCEAELVEELPLAPVAEEPAAEATPPRGKLAKRRPPPLQQTLLEASDGVPEVPPAVPAGHGAPSMCLVAPLPVWFGSSCLSLVPGAPDAVFVVDLNEGLGLHVRSVASAAAARAAPAAPKRRPRAAAPPQLELSLCAQHGGEAPEEPPAPRGASRPSTSLSMVDLEAPCSSAPRAPAVPRSARRPSLHRAGSLRIAGRTLPAQSPAPLPPSPAFGRGAAAAPLAPLAPSDRRKAKLPLDTVGAPSRSRSSPKQLGPPPTSAMALDLGGAADPTHLSLGASSPTFMRASFAERPPLPDVVMKGGRLSVGTKQAGFLPALPGAANSRAGAEGGSGLPSPWRTSSGRSLSLDHRRLRLVM